MLKQKRGFTLIELLAVIGIISVLASMLFLGARYVTNSTKKNGTRVVLQNLQAMVTEREAAIGATAVKAEINGLFTVPGQIDSSTIRSVEKEFPAQRYPVVPPATPNMAGVTQMVMTKLLTIQASRNAIGNLPPSQFLEAPFGTSAFTPPLILDSYGNPVLCFPSDGITKVKLNWSGKSSDTPGSTVDIRSPNGKPFFVSAGADGNFETGDDNIYSFEN